MNFTSDVIMFINDRGTITYLDNDNWLSAEAQDAINMYYDYDQATQIKSVREVLGCLPETFTNSQEALGYLIVTMKDGSQDTYVSYLLNPEEFTMDGMLLNDRINKDKYSVCMGSFPWWWSDDKKCWGEEEESEMKF